MRTNDRDYFTLTLLAMMLVVIAALLGQPFMSGMVTYLAGVSVGVASAIHAWRR